MCLSLVGDSNNTAVCCVCVHQAVDKLLLSCLPLLLLSLLLLTLTTDIHLVSEYGRRPLRSSTDRTLTVPRIRFGDLRQISSYAQFRGYLKNHLFGI